MTFVLVESLPEELPCIHAHWHDMGNGKAPLTGQCAVFGHKPTDVGGRAFASRHRIDKDDDR